MEYVIKSYSETVRRAWRVRVVAIAAVVYLVAGAIVIQNHNVSENAAAFPYAWMRASTEAIAAGSNSGQTSICGLPISSSASATPAVPSTTGELTATGELTGVRVSDIPALATCLHRHGYLTAAELADVRTYFAEPHDGGWSWAEIALYIVGFAGLVSALSLLVFARRRRPA